MFKFEILMFIIKRVDSKLDTISDCIERIKESKKKIKCINEALFKKHGNHLYFIDGMTQQFLDSCEISIREEYCIIIKEIFGIKLKAN